MSEPSVLMPKAGTGCAGNQHFCPASAGSSIGDYTCPGMSPLREALAGSVDGEMDGEVPLLVLVGSGSLRVLCF